MTTEGKLSIIGENLSLSASIYDDSVAISEGSILELALALASEFDPEEAAAAAERVIGCDDLMNLSRFCKFYTAHRKEVELPFWGEEIAVDKPNGIIIPEIPRLDLAIEELSAFGMKLEREYGESFAHCAGDVEGGHNRYVMFPMKSPEEGRLRAFDNLRDRYGLTVHGVINIAGADEGEYSYELCALGFSDTPAPKNRLSFSADVVGDCVKYFSPIQLFGASVLSATIEQKNSLFRVNAIIDISGLSTRDVAGLYMYLSTAADVIVDGYYAEF